MATNLTSCNNPVLQQTREPLEKQEIRHRSTTGELLKEAKPSSLTDSSDANNQTRIKHIVEKARSFKQTPSEEKPVEYTSLRQMPFDDVSPKENFTPEQTPSKEEIFVEDDPSGKETPPSEAHNGGSPEQASSGEETIAEGTSSEEKAPLEDTLSKVETLAEGTPSGDKALVEDDPLEEIIPECENVGSPKETFPEGERVELKKVLGLWDGVAIILGIMIGSGIFISPQSVARYTGSVGMSLLVWTLTCIPTTVSALCVAELGKKSLAHLGMGGFLALNKVVWH